MQSRGTADTLRAGERSGQETQTRRETADGGKDK